MALDHRDRVLEQSGQAVRIGLITAHEGDVVGERLVRLRLVDVVRSLRHEGPDEGRFPRAVRPRDRYSHPRSLLITASNIAHQLRSAARRVARHLTKREAPVPTIHHCALPKTSRAAKARKDRARAGSLSATLKRPSQITVATSGPTFRTSSTFTASASPP